VRLKTNILCVFVVAALGFLHGCTEGKHSFLIVQLCLGNEQSLTDFTKIMQSIAQAEQMNFVDGSAKTKGDLKAMGALRQSGPIIHMGVEREGGLAAVATNVGLPGYQVAVGFSQGKDPSEARLFAEKVVARLKARWQVEPVTPGKETSPLKTCGGEPAQ
jgi:hypothetical protein